MTELKCKRPVDYTTCTHCHLCRENCEFLSKYGLDIGHVEQLRELAYHCFLCGKCTSVCPEGIDGKAVILGLRQQRIDAGDDGIIDEKYKGLVKEKGEYKFRNYRHATSGAVFFPGCALPSMYPETTEKLVGILDVHGIGTVYDCCGKPIGEIGLKDTERQIISAIANRIIENGITELVLACPNCRSFFEEHLLHELQSRGISDFKLTGIYEKLAQLSAGKAVNHDARFFVPCPDRKKLEWLREVKHFVKGKVSVLEGPQCCGLGGCAAANEPELSRGFGTSVGKLIAGSDITDSNVYVYCASCGGKFRRSGIEGISHILTEILETYEIADIQNSFVNRSRTGKL